MAQQHTDNEWLDNILFLAIPESVVNYEALRRGAKKSILTELHKRETEAYDRMHDTIETEIKAFDGGDRNINGGLNTEMTGWGAMDFVTSARDKLKSTTAINQRR